MSVSYTLLCPSFLGGQVVAPPVKASLSNGGPMLPPRTYAIAQGQIIVSSAANAYGVYSDAVALWDTAFLWLTMKGVWLVDDVTRDTIVTRVGGYPPGNQLKNTLDSASIANWFSPLLP